MYNNDKDYKVVILIIILIKDIMVARNEKG